VKTPGGGKTLLKKNFAPLRLCVKKTNITQKKLRALASSWPKPLWPNFAEKKLRASVPLWPKLAEKKTN